MLPNETVTRTSRILLEFRAAEGRWVCQGFAKIAPENGRKRDFSVRDHNLARRLHSMRDYELRRWEGLGKRRTFFIVYLRGRPRVRIAPGAPDSLENRNFGAIFYGSSFLLTSMLALLFALPVSLCRICQRRGAFGVRRLPTDRFPSVCCQQHTGDSFSGRVRRFLVAVLRFRTAKALPAIGCCTFIMLSCPAF